MNELHRHYARIVRYDFIHVYKHTLLMPGEKSANATGIIQYSLGGQVGMSDMNLYNFFNGLTPDKVNQVVANIKQWKYVDGLDIDIEPAEVGGKKYTSDFIEQKVVPLSIAVKKIGRPITTTSY